MGQLVAKVRTTRTPQQAADNLAQAWELHTGQPVSGAVLALLLALSDLETATWQSMFNWNWGNIVKAQYSGDYFPMLDSGNPREFRAYPDPVTGALGLVKLLHSDTRTRWREGLLTGDPTAFVNALAGKSGKPAYAYFEANPETYLKGFLARWERYKHLRAQQPPAPPPSTPSRGGPVAGVTRSGKAERASGWLVSLALLLVGAVLTATNGRV